MEAELHDGTVLEFPDGTDPAVIQRVVKQRLGVNKNAGPNGEYQEPAWLTQQRGELAEQTKDAPGGMEGMLKSFADSASFGFADELAGGVSALTGGDYESARKDFDARKDKFAALAPGAAGAAGVAGGLATGGPIGKAVAATRLGKAAATLPKWKQLALAGGSAGGAYGAGSADPGERLEGAAKGAALGAAVGVAVPAAISGGANLVRKGARATGDAGKTLGRYLFSGGSGTPDRAAAKIAQALRRDQTTPQQLQANLRELGPDAMMVDAAGENLRGLGEVATSIPGKAKDVGKKALEERAKGAQKRIVQTITKTLGVDDLDFDSAVQGLHQNMRDVAKQHGYDEILNTGTVEMNPGLEKLMSGSSIKKALGQAYSILDDDISLGRADAKLRQFFTFTNPRTGEKIPVTELEASFAKGINHPSGMRFDPDNFSLAEAPTLRVWDYVKRGLDNIIQDGTDPVTGKLSSQAERVTAIKKSLMGHLDDGNSNYKAVRGAYADEKAAESAVNAGRRFMRDDAETTARHLTDMSEAEQQFFRMGAARALHDKVMNSVDTGTSWRSVVKNPLIRGKIEKLFPDESARAEFMKSLEREMHFAETRQVVNPMAKSPTGRILAGQSDMGNVPDMIDAGASAAQGRLMSAATAIGRVLKNRNAAGLPEPVRDEVSDALFSRDPQKIQQVYAKLLRQPEFRAALTRQPANVTLGAISGQQAAAQR